MSRTLRTAALVVGMVAIAATGVGAFASAGAFAAAGAATGASAAVLGTTAGTLLAVGSIGSAVAGARSISAPLSDPR